MAGHMLQVRSQLTLQEKADGKLDAASSNRLCLLRILESLLSWADKLSFPLEWTAEFLCVQDPNHERYSADLRQLLHAAFDDLDERAFVQVTSICATFLDESLSEMWGPADSARARTIFVRWRAMQVKLHFEWVLVPAFLRLRAAQCSGVMKFV